jgi:hypothetical protein
MSTSRTTEGALSGQLAVIKRAKPGTPVTETTLVMTNWNFPIDGKLKDISNFRDGRRVAGTLPNATLSGDVVWDPDGYPTDVSGMGLRPGQTVTIRLYVNAEQDDFFQAVFKVATIGPRVAVDNDVLMMPVTFQLNSGIDFPGDTPAVTVV